MVNIRVQTADFDLSTEVAALRACGHQIGAVACFIGTVREWSGDAVVEAMELEHYPGMTEQALQTIANAACCRWPGIDVLIVHRVGKLAAGDQIVLVAATAPHRADAFAACEFVMDFLKTRAPFWKKEKTLLGERWVEARDADDVALARWDASLPRARTS